MVISAQKRLSNTHCFQGILVHTSSGKPANGGLAARCASVLVCSTPIQVLTAPNWFFVAQRSTMGSTMKWHSRAALP